MKTLPRSFVVALRFTAGVLLFPVCLAAGAETTAGKPGTKPVWRSKVFNKRMVEIDVKLPESRKIWLVVSDGGDGNGCDWANWIEPRVETAKGEIKLSAIEWRSATSGHGEVRVGLSAGGTPLMTDGTPSMEGIGIIQRD